MKTLQIRFMIWIIEVLMLLMLLPGRDPSAIDRLSREGHSLIHQLDTQGLFGEK